MFCSSTSNQSCTYPNYHLHEKLSFAPQPNANSSSVFHSNRHLFAFKLWMENVHAVMKYEDLKRIEYSGYI